jgi:hypothetical protein
MVGKWVVSPSNRLVHRGHPYRFVRQLVTFSIGTSKSRALAYGRNIALGAVAVAAAFTLVAGPAMAAAAAPVYRNIPSTLPGNVPSIGFEATSTSEFGDLVTLLAGSRASANLPVTVIMSSWACQTGGGATCQTTPGATWNQSITLNLYNADTTVTPPVAGAKITSKTQTFAIRYRPSFDAAHCPSSGNHAWYSTAEAKCYSGFAQPITFTLPSGVTLPDTLIWSIAFNTEHHGYSPTGENGPWNSLNVGAQTFSGEPSVGQDVEPDSAFLNSTWTDAYKDGGLAGTGTFRDDIGGWVASAPLACFGACPILSAVATPTPAGTPTEDASGTEQVGGATGTPRTATPPPTGTSAPSGDGSSTSALLLICVAAGGLGLLAVTAQRRELRP